MINSTTADSHPELNSEARPRLGGHLFKRLFARLAMFVAASAMFGSVALSTGCRSCSQKPDEKSCQEAIANIRNIRNTTSMATGASPRKAIRSCQGNATRKSVKCFIAAKNEADLEACKRASGSNYLEDERKAREDFDLKAKENAEKDAAKKAAESEGE